MRRMCLFLVGLAMAAGCERQAVRPNDKPEDEIQALPLAEPPPLNQPASKTGDHLAADVPAADEALKTEAPDEEPLSPNVKLRLEVYPKSAKAFVSWGRKRLGPAPLLIERPRNSGPLDIVITANGFLPYHTRIFTERNEKWFVNMVQPSEARTLLGFKHMPDAGQGTRDGGAPGASSGDAGVPPKADASGPSFVIPQAVQF